MKANQKLEFELKYPSYLHKKIMQWKSKIAKKFKINMEKYKVIKTIGDGTYGSVVKAYDVKTGEVVAIK